MLSSGCSHCRNTAVSVTVLLRMFVLLGTQHFNMFWFSLHRYDFALMWIVWKADSLGACVVPAVVPGA